MGETRRQIRDFLSNPPFGFNAEATNLYEYVGNNPVNGLDPSGLATLRSTEGVSAAIGNVGGTMNQIEGAHGRGISLPIPWMQDDDLRLVFFFDEAYAGTRRRGLQARYAGVYVDLTAQIRCVNKASRFYEHPGPLGNALDLKELRLIQIRRMTGGLKLEEVYANRAAGSGWFIDRDAIGEEQRNPWWIRGNQGEILTSFGTPNYYGYDGVDKGDVKNSFQARLYDAPGVRLGEAGGMEFYTYAIGNFSGRWKVVGRIHWSFTVRGGAVSFRFGADGDTEPDLSGAIAAWNSQRGYTQVPNLQHIGAD